MNDGTIPSILLIVFFLAASAYFSATETAYSSLNKTRLRTMAGEGNQKALKTLDLSERYDKLLTSILVGNNIVNIAMASVSTLLFVRMLPNAGATVSTIVITVLVLIFGEISPKTMARQNPEKFAMAVMPFMRVLVAVLTPINFLFSKWQNLLRRIFKLDETQIMTEDELSMLVEEAAQGGSIEEDEGDMVRNVLAFDEHDVEDVLTPRVDLIAVDLQTQKADVAQVFSEHGYSRLPVYLGSIDHIVGILNRKDFYTGEGISEQPLLDLIREPLFVPKSVMIDELFRTMQQKKEQMAVVSDEFGGTLGIVTMEDIIEELMGEIWDEHEEKVQLFAPAGENAWRVNASADMDQLEELLGEKLDSDSATPGGWVMEQLGRIPKVGDSFAYADLNVTVTDMATDGNRLREIKVVRQAREPDLEAADAGADAK